MDSTGGILKRFFPPSRGRGRRSRHRFGLIAPPVPSLDTAVTDCCRSVSPFRFCTCLNVIGYFILLPVCGIVAISYYAVIIIVWGPRLFHAGEVSSSSILPLFIVVLFHLLLLLLIWSYFMVVFRDPGTVPENWIQNLNEEGFEVGTSTSSGVNTPIFMASSWSPSDGRRRHVRYCSRCQHIKPPRCHHCSICQRCVLKMDHHCVWVVNCVGAHNYKFFLLFLFYAFLATILDTFALLPHLVKLFGHNKLSGSPDDYGVICLVFGLSLYLALSLLAFLVIHTSLLLSNATTIEVAQKKKQIKWKYDMGKRNNFEQVFGTKKLLWLLPIYSEEDFENVPALQGLNFPTRPDAEGL